MYNLFNGGWFLRLEAMIGENASKVSESVDTRSNVVSIYLSLFAKNVPKSKERMRFANNATVYKNTLFCKM